MSRMLFTSSSLYFNWNCFRTSHISLTYLCIDHHHFRFNTCKVFYIKLPWKIPCKFAAGTKCSCLMGVRRSENFIMHSLHTLLQDIWIWWAKLSEELHSAYIILTIQHDLIQALVFKYPLLISVMLVGIRVVGSVFLNVWYIVYIAPYIYSPIKWQK